jgi:hypothetical protein
MDFLALDSHRKTSEEKNCFGPNSYLGRKIRYAQELSRFNFFAGVRFTSCSDISKKKLRQHVSHKKTISPGGPGGPRLETYSGGEFCYPKEYGL